MKVTEIIGAIIFIVVIGIAVNAFTTSSSNEKFNEITLPTGETVMKNVTQTFGNSKVEYSFPEQVYPVRDGPYLKYSFNFPIMLVSGPEIVLDHEDTTIEKNGTRWTFSYTGNDIDVKVKKDAPADLGTFYEELVTAEHEKINGGTLIAEYSGHNAEGAKVGFTVRIKFVGVDT